jgi:putative Ca2+/H+ antiporter (TMEM165/GDT1 family)
MDARLLFTVFALVFTAELPGKTTFATFLLASNGKPRPVALGAGLAFALHSLIAVAAGSLLGFLPPRAVQAAAGILFLIMAALLWLEKPEAARAVADDRAHFAKAFSVTFAMQWGDPSQLATAALAAKYGAPVPVFFSATLALWAVTALAAAAGHFGGQTIQPPVLRKLAAGIFAAGGLVLLAGCFVK